MTRLADAAQSRRRTKKPFHKFIPAAPLPKLRTGRGTYNIDMVDVDFFFSVGLVTDGTEVESWRNARGLLDLPPLGAPEPEFSKRIAYGRVWNHEAKKSL